MELWAAECLKTGGQADLIELVRIVHFRLFLDEKGFTSDSSETEKDADFIEKSQ